MIYIAVVCKLWERSESGHWASFIDKQKSKVIEQARKRCKEWELQGHGPYKILVGTVTEEVKEQPTYSLTPLGECENPHDKWVKMCQERWRREGNINAFDNALDNAVRLVRENPTCAFCGVRYNAHGIMIHQFVEHLSEVSKENIPLHSVWDVPCSC
jgi:hypothetical protein